MRWRGAQTLGRMPENFTACAERKESPVAGALAWDVVWAQFPVMTQIPCVTLDKPLCASVSPVSREYASPALPPSDAVNTSQSGRCSRTIGIEAIQVPKRDTLCPCNAAQYNCSCCTSPNHHILLVPPREQDTHRGW